MCVIQREADFYFYYNLCFLVVKDLFFILTQGLNYMSRMLPLTHTLLVMGDRSGLIAYDLSSGDVIRRVLFGMF